MSYDDKNVFFQLREISPGIMGSVEDRGKEGFYIYNIQVEDRNTANVLGYFNGLKEKYSLIKAAFVVNHQLNYLLKYRWGARLTHEIINNYLHAVWVWEKDSWYCNLLMLDKENMESIMTQFVETAIQIELAPGVFGRNRIMIRKAALDEWIGKSEG